jgi:hypothetical protein
LFTFGFYQIKHHISDITFAKTQNKYLSIFKVFTLRFQLSHSFARRQNPKKMNNGKEKRSRSFSLTRWNVLFLVVVSQIALWFFIWRPANSEVGKDTTTIRHINHPGETEGEKFSSPVSGIENVVVWFYTPQYEERAQRLAESCVKHNISYWFTRLKNHEDLVTAQ